MLFVATDNFIVGHPPTLSISEGGKGVGASGREGE